MRKIFQVVKDGKATEYKFHSPSNCMSKMRMLQKEYPKSIITFLEIDL